jgi:PASTA domain
MPDDKQEPREGRTAAPDETAPMPASGEDTAAMPASGEGTAAMPAPDNTTPMAAPDSTVPMAAPDEAGPDTATAMPGPDHTAPMPAVDDRTAHQAPIGDTTDQSAAEIWSARAEVPPPGAGYPAGDTVYAPRPATEWEQVEPDDGGKWWLPIVLGLIGLLLLGVLIYGLWLIFAADQGPESPGPAVTTSAAPRPTPTTQAPRTTPPAPTETVAVDVVVPPVAGRSLADARSALDAVGLSYRLEYRTTDSQPPGTVIGTNPPGGTRVPGGTEVTITVASAPRTAEPPPPPPPATPTTSPAATPSR